MSDDGRDDAPRNRERDHDAGPPGDVRSELRAHELHDDLEATSDSVIADAQRLIEIEREKQARRPGDGLQPVLGREARVIADALGRKTVAEDEIAQQLGRETRDR